MADTIAKYKAYKFEIDANWQNHLRNFYPTPSYEQIENIKKKWYKKNIDPNFDCNYASQKSQDPQSSSHNQSPSSNRSSNDQSRPARRGRLNTLSKYQLMLFICFMVACPIGIITRTSYAYPLFVAYLIGIVQSVGFIQFNKVYWSNLITNEDFHSLIMSGIAFFTSCKTAVIWIPQFLIALIFVSQCLKILSRNYEFIQRIFGCLYNPIISNINELNLLIWDIEIYLGFYLFICIFMGWASIFTALIHWQLMQMRYLTSQSINLAFARLGYTLNMIASDYRCPGILSFLLRKLYSLGVYLGSMHTQSANSGQSGPSMCSIF